MIFSQKLSCLISHGAKDQNFIEVCHERQIHLHFAREEYEDLRRVPCGGSYGSTWFPAFPCKDSSQGKHFNSEVVHNFWAQSCFPFANVMNSFSCRCLLLSYSYLSKGTCVFEEVTSYYSLQHSALNILDLGGNYPRG